MYPKAEFARFYRLLIFGAFLLILLSAAIATAGDNQDSSLSGEGRGLYQGDLRIYVVEPDSRWVHEDGVAWHNGFLAFAYDTSLSLAYLQTFDRSLTWAPCPDVSPISQSNIKVIAVMFNKMQGYPADSDPYSGNGDFTAYYVDATAAAEPGETGYNQTTPSSTHTVFIEEICSETCENCPYTRDAIYTLDTLGNHNFHYATITPKNKRPDDDEIRENYQTSWLPTAYYDGGYVVMVGASSHLTFYENFLDSSSARTVPDIDLSISLTYNTKGSLGIDVSVTCNANYNSDPGQPATPDGPAGGFLDYPYTYVTSATDSDGDQLYYRWSWDDGDTSVWMGPYNSGDTCQASHSWSTADTYQIKVQAKDIYNAESVWSGTASASFEGYAYMCGDANDDQKVNSSDAVVIINYVFIGGMPPDPLCVGDANGDGKTNSSDAVVIINYVFTGGYAPLPDCCNPPW